MRSARTSTLVIRTPEGITFSLLLASPVTRFLAYFIDISLISVAMSLLGVMVMLLQIFSGDMMQAVFILAFFVVQIGYGIVAEWFWRGQTIGKRLLRLRVMDVQGLRLQFSQIVIRNLLRCVDILPALYLVGGLATLLNRRAQRLGDLAANTIVVRSPSLEEPNLDQLLAGKYNSLREYPHLEGRLRQRVSPQEASIALQALVRRDELDTTARVELFSEIASHFRSVVKFPPEATEGIADEQYVRNVVDVLFRPKGKGKEKELLAGSR